jgi:hypothetical protein
MTDTTESRQANVETEKLSPELQRKIKRLHKQMDAAEATGGVIPPTPIINRVTGQKTPFGPRRAYDGSYLLELLSALGCTGEQVASTRYVLDLLNEHDLKIDKSLPNLLQCFCEQRTTEDEAERHRKGFHIVE